MKVEMTMEEYEEFKEKIKRLETLENGIENAIKKETYKDKSLGIDTIRMNIFIRKKFVVEMAGMSTKIEDMNKITVKVVEG